MPMNLFENQFPKVKLLTTDHKLYGYSGKPSDVLGKCTLPCSHKVIKLNLEFYIIKTTAPTVLTSRACTDLTLIKIVLSVTDTKDNISSLMYLMVLDYFQVSTP